MKTPYVLLAFVSLLFVGLILGCSDFGQAPTCNKPYILVGTDCCLDQNDNAICDSDESATPGATTPESTTPTVVTSSATARSCDLITTDDIKNVVGMDVGEGVFNALPGQSCSRGWLAPELGSVELYVSNPDLTITESTFDWYCTQYHEIDQIGDYCTTVTFDKNTIYFGVGAYEFHIRCEGTDCSQDKLVELAKIAVSNV